MERRVFTVHDRQYYFTKEQMKVELGVPDEDVETVWEDGGRTSPTCPKCRSQIDHLRAFCTEENSYNVYLDVQVEDGSSMLDWSTSKVVESSEIREEYTCPECGEVLFEWREGDSEVSHQENRDKVCLFLFSGQYNYRPYALPFEP